MTSLKLQLYHFCITYIQQRIDTAQRAIQIAQASANEETKSSAGDKYETGRAMMQLEIEKNTIQLNEALKLKQILDQFDPQRPTMSVQLGSLVTASGQHYYIAVSAGQILIENKVYFAISLASPIGAELKGKKVGETFVFNKKNISIEQIV